MSSYANIITIYELNEIRQWREFDVNFRRVIIGSIFN